MKVNAVTFSNKTSLNRNNNIQKNKSQTTLANFDSVSSLKNQILFKSLDEFKNPIPLDPKRSYLLSVFRQDLGLNMDLDLLHQVFVHHSMLDKINVSPVKYDNRRLAYVGENVMQMALAKIIYEEKEDLEPRQMVEISRSILTQDNLVEIAKQMRMDDFLLIDEEYLRGRVPKKPYAEILRALIGAIVVNDKDAGLDEASDFVRKLFINDVKLAVDNVGENSKEQLKNYVISKKFDPSKIRYITTMKDNGFASRLYYDKQFLATAFKDYKEQAEQAAAANAVGYLTEGMIKLK